MFMKLLKWMYLNNVIKTNSNAFDKSQYAQEKKGDHTEKGHLSGHLPGQKMEKTPCLAC